MLDWPHELDACSHNRGCRLKSVLILQQPARWSARHQTRASAPRREPTAALPPGYYQQSPGHGSVGICPLGVYAVLVATLLGAGSCLQAAR
jgi:hypothetical protein